MPVTGMSCAACARRVERALSGAGGVASAGVNLATEKATVRHLAGESVRDLEGAVADAGYGVVREASAEEETRDREYRVLRADFLLAAALTALVLVGSLPVMFGFEPPVPMGAVGVALLLLATPVQFWAGRRFYRGRGVRSGTGPRT